MTRTIILSLLLSACSVDPDAFSVRGGQEYETTFETASQAWCEASDGACCPHPDQSGESSVRPATAEELAGLARGYELSGYYVTDGDSNPRPVPRRRPAQNDAPRARPPLRMRFRVGGRHAEG
jgi:hypothetical protein